MNKIFFCSIIALFIVTLANAQDFDFGVYKVEDMVLKSYKNDTSAHAVVLNEYGYAYLSDRDYLPIIFEHHVKIKIFDNAGFKHGDIRIPLYTEDPELETLEEIKGVTIYTDDNGITKKAYLDNKQVFTTKQNKYWSTVKFAMPNLRPGCVIEYRYRIISRLRNQFRSWDFQSDIPKLYSEYRAKIPGVYNYNISLRGALKLLEAPEYKPQLDRECFSFNGIKCDCSVFRFAMKDIPAFIEEDFMTSSRNFISAMYFELTDYTDMGTGSNKKVSKEWKDVDYELLHADYFGGQLKKKDIFKERLMPVLAGKTDELGKAQAVYNYIKQNIKWNDFTSIGSNDGIRKAFDKHEGTVGDINLGLAAALKLAGIKADVVLLSTREHGLLSKIFPVIGEFNYVIVKVDIADKSYFLDATDPLLPFGMLPMRCLNDQGRVICADKPSYWIDIPQQKRSDTHSFDFTLMNNGKLKGTIVNYFMGYDGYVKRAAIKKFNTIDEYVEDLDEKQPRLKILKSNIDNLDSLESGLVETYEVEIDTYDNLNAGRVTFNPFIFERMIENPLKLKERSYPVDIGMPENKRVTLTVQLPENYSIENQPKPINIALPNNGGRFITAFEVDKNKFSFSHAINFKRSVYLPEEYLHLKEFYNQIILSEKADLVFKKN